MARIPHEKDNRENFVVAPMTTGMMAWWTGAGDNLATGGLGEGDQFQMIFTGAETKTVVASFTSYVELYDGEAWWSDDSGLSNWGNADRWDLAVLIKQNSSNTTPNGTNTGNCNVVPSGMGFDIIVPAAGDGAYDVDLTKAHPLPCEGSGMHFWDIPDFIDGTIVPALDGASPAGGYGLVHNLDWRVYFCKNMPCGSPRGIFLVDSDKAEPVHKNWCIEGTVEKTTSGAGEFGFWLKFFRPQTDKAG